MYVHLQCARLNLLMVAGVVMSEGKQFVTSKKGDVNPNDEDPTGTQNPPSKH